LTNDDEAPLPPSPAQLFLWHGVALYIGPITDNSVHRHYALQLTISTGEDFLIHSGDSDIETVFHLNAVEQPHALNSQNRPVAILLVEPDSTLGNAVLTCLADGMISPVSYHLAAVDLPKTREDASAYIHAVAKVFGVEDKNEPAGNDKLDRVLGFLAEHPGEAASARDMAELACLSESRFLHLFSEQVGLPFRRYLKWKRLLEAVKAAGAGKSLTEAAHAAGFSDSAHLSRVFREMFGFAPSQILQDSRFVQVIVCE